MNNVGYALVESLTADVYAVRLNSTGAAAGTVLVPNLAWGPDTNIIMFPIRPRHTKAGTLDGKIGFANDPDYPDADQKRGSYFKPSEAYATKTKINNDILSLWAYGAQASSGAPGTR